MQVQVEQLDEMGEYELLSEHIEAWVMRSSEALMFSSSRVVSSTLPLFCGQKSFKTPLSVVQSNALLAGLGCQGPKAWTKELS